MHRILLDTSFIISLLDCQRSNHLNAKKYYKYFLENAYELFFSTISISEYCVKGQIDELPLEDFTEILPFNFDDAILSSKYKLNEIRQANDKRDVVKDDIKIISQAIGAKCNFVVTDDERTFFKYTNKIKELSNLGITPIAIKENFDISYFNNNQLDLPYENEV